MEWYDEESTAPDGRKIVTKRQRIRAGSGAANIFGDNLWSGNDSAGNSVGVGEDASGNGNAGSSASGW